MRYVADQARDAIRKPVRYYITSGGPTERVPADSPFASLVLKGLAGEADFWHDGFISAEELGMYLQRNVPVHARLPLHPQRSAIADETARLSSGQFMFLTGLAASTVVAVGDENERLVGQSRACEDKKYFDDHYLDCILQKPNLSRACEDKKYFDDHYLDCILPKIK
jgi:hypothetical protein